MRALQAISGESAADRQQTVTLLTCLRDHLAAPCLLPRRAAGPPKQLPLSASVLPPSMNAPPQRPDHRRTCRGGAQPSAGHPSHQLLPVEQHRSAHRMRMALSPRMTALMALTSRSVCLQAGASVSHVPFTSRACCRHYRAHRCLTLETRDTQNAGKGRRGALTLTSRVGLLGPVRGESGSSRLLELCHSPQTFTLQVTMVEMTLWTMDMTSCTASGFPSPSLSPSPSLRASTQCCTTHRETCPGNCRWGGRRASSSEPCLPDACKALTPWAAHLSVQRHASQHISGQHERRLPSTRDSKLLAVRQWGNRANVLQAQKQLKPCMLAEQASRSVEGTMSHPRLLEFQHGQFCLGFFAQLPAELGLGVVGCHLRW